MPVSTFQTKEVYWPHAPVHRLSESGTFFVTARTYHGAHHFAGGERIAVLFRGLLSVANEFGWHLDAWAVFSNHYHFVGHSPPDKQGAQTLTKMLGKLHMQTAKWVNLRDESPGRQVWHNYWESRLTFHESYFARLNYTHSNAVKHGLVANPSDYPWCSAGWLERTASLAQVQTIYGMKIDRLNVGTDPEPSFDW